MCGCSSAAGGPKVCCCGWGTYDAIMRKGGCGVGCWWECEGSEGVDGVGFGGEYSLSPLFGGDKEFVGLILVGSRLSRQVFRVWALLLRPWFGRARSLF